MNHCRSGSGYSGSRFRSVGGGCHHRSPRASIVRSNFIFEATVQQVGGSTLPDYPGWERRR